MGWQETIFVENKLIPNTILTLIIFIHNKKMRIIRDKILYLKDFKFYLQYSIYKQIMFLNSIWIKN